MTKRIQLHSVCTCMKLCLFSITRQWLGCEGGGGAVLKDTVRVKCLAL